MHAKVVVEIHDNTHTMVTFQKQRGLWRLRLHHMFLPAPESILDALGEFVRRSDADSSAVLDKFIEKNKTYIRRLPPAKLQKRTKLLTKGKHHDLGEIYLALNARYFNHRIDAAITFGPAPKSQGPRKSIKMGSYAPDSRIIRIHPVLDQARVPRYFVEWIVFHEMLHRVYPARRTSEGRRCVHPPEFNAHEKTFHAFVRAQRWERENLDLLLNRRIPTLRAA